MVGVMINRSLKMFTIHNEDTWVLLIVDQMSYRLALKGLLYMGGGTLPLIDALDIGIWNGTLPLN